MSTPNYRIFLYLRKSRPTKEGKFPVYIRIRVNKDKYEYPSGQFVKAEHWNDTTQKAHKFKEASTVNGILDTAKSNINQAVSQLYMSATEVTLDNVRSLLNGETVTQTYTLLRVAQEHNENFEKLVPKKNSAGSYKNYKTTLKYLKEFVPIYSGRKDLDLKGVNYKFCEAFFTFLTTDKNCHTNGTNNR